VFDRITHLDVYRSAESVVMYCHVHDA